MFLQICAEGITVANTGKLALLKPYFDKLGIHACLVAKESKGKAFCTKLAVELVAWVTGAVELQGNTKLQTLYGFIDNKKHHGDYYIHQPSGARTVLFRSR